MKIKDLVDTDHPLVIEKAEELTGHIDGDAERVASIFNYVRDGITFAFPCGGDLVAASETIKSARGQCNTKGTLFLALCRAAGIEARLHFSSIKKEIQRGLFTGLMYRLMPDEISHSWIEVKLEGRWHRIDAYINDFDFYQKGKSALAARNWDTGFSISCSAGSSTADLDFEDEGFVQMDAVVKDHGIHEPEDYFASELYLNRPGFFKLFIYRLVVGRINRRVEKMRSSE